MISNNWNTKPAADQPRGIKTDGIGSYTSSHLNLTRTLADVWASEWANRYPPKPVEPAKMGRPPGPIVSPKHPYAGRE